MIFQWENSILDDIRHHAQLCWRMIFEEMKGYFDIDDYLYQIAKQ